MSTNYYLKFKNKKNQYETVHIGKQSCGWRFIAESHNLRYFKNYIEFMEWLRKGTIMVENSYAISLNEFMEEISPEYGYRVATAARNPQMRVSDPYEFQISKYKKFAKKHKVEVDKWGEFTFGPFLFTVDENFC